MSHSPGSISVKSYTYELPDNRIARYPLKNRDQSKILIYKNNQISEDRFCHLDQHLEPDNILVFNNTKVIHARLAFHKETGARIEIFCLEPVLPPDYQLIFQQTRKVRWRCMVGNLKKWKEGDLQLNIRLGGHKIRLTAHMTEKGRDTHIIEFNWDSDKISFGDILENTGIIPIPPYLQRESEELDKERYQTIYSKKEGSVAAPTAGLHFTEETFNKIRKKGIETAEVTLHVGAGTFQPVKSETIGDHPMHRELISVKKSEIERLTQHIDQVIAVGTTSLRTLESLYWLGIKIMNTSPNEAGIYNIEQWEPYENDNNIPVKEALMNLIHFMEKQGMESINASTRIIIVPGYNFKIVKGLVTNFHQPRSTLLLLVAAFTKNKWKDIYNYALDHEFRFLSYGDSSLLFRGS